MTEPITTHCHQCRKLTEQRVTKTEAHPKFTRSQIISESECLTCGQTTRHFHEDICLDSIYPNGATIDDLTSLSTFEITGRGTAYVCLPMWNRRALRGRTITVDGKKIVVNGVESCLVGDHDEGYCDRGTAIIGRPVD